MKKNIIPALAPVFLLSSLQHSNAATIALDIEATTQPASEGPFIFSTIFDENLPPTSTNNSGTSQSATYTIPPASSSFTLGTEEFTGTSTTITIVDFNNNNPDRIILDFGNFDDANGNSVYTGGDIRFLTSGSGLNSTDLSEIFRLSEDGNLNINRIDINSVSGTGLQPTLSSVAGRSNLNNPVVNVTKTAIPEPSAALLGFVGLGFALQRRRPTSSGTTTAFDHAPIQQ